MEGVGRRIVEAVVGGDHRVDSGGEERVLAGVLDQLAVDVAAAPVDYRLAVLLTGHHRHGVSPFSPGELTVARTRRSPRPQGVGRGDRLRVERGCRLPGGERLIE